MHLNGAQSISVIRAPRLEADLSVSHLVAFNVMRKRLRYSGVKLQIVGLSQIVTFTSKLSNEDFIISDSRVFCNVTKFPEINLVTVALSFPADTGRKLNVHNTFRRRPLIVLRAFNLRPVSMTFTIKAALSSIFLLNL